MVIVGVTVGNGVSIGSDTCTYTACTVGIGAGSVMTCPQASAASANTTISRFTSPLVRWQLFQSLRI